MEVKIQAYKRRTQHPRKKYDISRLEEDKEIQEHFKLELTNRLQILTDMERVENETIEEKCRNIRTSFTEASQKVLGFKEKNKKDWMTQQTWEKIRERKKVKYEMNVNETGQRRLNCRRNIRKRTQK